MLVVVDGAAESVTAADVYARHLRQLPRHTGLRHRRERVERPAGASSVKWR